MDLYSKAIFTVIAISLAAIAIQGSIPKANAVGEGCGLKPDRPCFVTTPFDVDRRNFDPLAVQIVK
ncbi:MAG: hypothetical protein AAF362_19240 [Pseudomonadota bacterium]